MFRPQSCEGKGAGAEVELLTITIPVPIFIRVRDSCKGGSVAAIFRYLISTTSE